MLALSASFEYLCYGSTTVINNIGNNFSALIDFIRQNLTSVDVRFWRLKTVPHADRVNNYLPPYPLTGICFHKTLSHKITFLISEEFSHQNSCAWSSPGDNVVWPTELSVSTENQIVLFLILPRSHISETSGPNSNILISGTVSLPISFQRWLDVKSYLTYLSLGMAPCQCCFDVGSTS